MIRPPVHLLISTMIVAFGLPALSGCGAAPGAGDAASSAVRINKEEIPYAEFEAYLSASFGKELPPVEDAETRSRLLDQFIEERLLLQLAGDKKIRIEDAKVDAYLTNLGAGTETAPGGKPVDAVFREQVRRNLLIEEYKDRVLLKEVHVAPEEVEAYYKDHPGEFREGRAVVLRQILLDDAGEAKQLQARLKQAPEQFQLLAERHSVSPDHGQPRPYEEEELPESMRVMVFALEPGQISEVVEEGGKYRIFQAVDRHEGKNETLDEVRKKIEVLLMRRKAEASLSRALAEVKGKARIQIHRKNIPFTYRGEYGA